jgi:hypothetical protein
MGRRESNNIFSPSAFPSFSPPGPTRTESKKEAIASGSNRMDRPIRTAGSFPWVCQMMPPSRRRPALLFFCIKQLRRPPIRAAPLLMMQKQLLQ